MKGLSMYIHEQFGSDPLGMKIVENAQRKIDNMIMEHEDDKSSTSLQENSITKIAALQIEQQKENIKNFIKQTLQDYERGVTNREIFTRNMMCYFSNYIRLLSVEEIKNLLSISLNVENMINEKGE
jgi:hypothetical protein